MGAMVTFPGGEVFLGGLPLRLPLGKQLLHVLWTFAQVLQAKSVRVFENFLEHVATLQTILLFRIGFDAASL